MFTPAFLPTSFFPARTLAFPLLKFMTTPLCLKTLLKGIPVVKWTGPKENVLIQNLAIHSQAVQPNGLFFAIKGEKNNGLHFLEEAITRGATVIVSEEPLKHFGQLTHIQVADVRTTLALIAQRFYNKPDDKITLTGITGTNGKTTVSWMLRHIYNEGLREKTGLLGTLHYDLGERYLPATRTTPDAISLSAYLDEMIRSQCQNAILEVASHGIHQKRVAGLAFDTAVFTNLGIDHLDYHKNMEAYFDAKRSFFNQKGLKRAVINGDDAYGQRLLTQITCPVVTFGLETKAMLQAKHIESTLLGTTFDLVYPGGKLKVKMPLLGTFNVYNCLAALAVCYAQGRSLKEAVHSLETFDGVPGRLEFVKIQKPFSVLVDYAHKPQALENVLRTLRPLTKGRLLLVFGCGGERDRTKRPLMTQLAHALADYTWATSDNPRGEPQTKIFEDMRADSGTLTKMSFISDRRQAINEALSNCRNDDCLLIAGKGHERYQEINEQLLPFDDREIVKEFFK